MNSKATIDSLAFFWSTLTGNEKAAFSESQVALKETLARRWREIVESTFVIPLSDEGAVRLLAQTRANPVAEAIVRFWRWYAFSRSYWGPVAWKVKKGFTLKVHAPLVGPCYEDLKYLQAWDFPDTPTTDSLVFWVPLLAEESKSKSPAEMVALRAEQQRSYNLPVNHCSSFGSIALLTALVSAHFKRTGERVPLNWDNAASDTIRADGFRLMAQFNPGGPIYCGAWENTVTNPCVGFFLLGIEELGRPVANPTDQSESEPCDIVEELGQPAVNPASKPRIEPLHLGELGDFGVSAFEDDPFHIISGGDKNKPRPREGDHE